MRREELFIRDIMTPNTHVISPGSTLQDAMDLLLQCNIEGAPVVNCQNEVVGMVTRTDIMHALNMNMKLGTPVEVIMTDNVFVVGADDLLEVAQELILGEKHLGRLPVVDNARKLIGILTRTDLIKALAARLGMMNSRLQAIVGSIPDGILATDENGITTYVNPQFEKIAGISAADSIGRGLKEIMPELEPETVLREGADLNDVQVKLGDNTVLVNASPVYLNRQIMGLVAVLKDMTEFQKMAQEITSLNEINENLHAIFSSINEGIHAVNKEGITIFYNEAAAALDGLTGENVVGKHLFEVIPSLTPETSTLMKVIRTGKPILNKQQTFQNLKGQTVTTINSTIPLRSNGVLIGAVELSHNITQVRKLSERVMDLQAELYRTEYNKKQQVKAAPAGGAQFTFDDIVGNCEQMLKLKFMAYKAAQSSSSVLVYGETGTGKELVVHSIHNASKRRGNPFIPQNCAALPEALLEGILFGTVKGGFTGAEDRPGLFELANGGTLFLDEINSMNLELQAKLLRVLQEGVVRRVADTKLRPIDVRVITATNIDPQQAMEQGKLRPDLYYRLNVVSLRIPPLRERRDDIPLLVQHFLNKYNEVLGLDVREVAPAVLEIFQSYHWPGNVRELEHTIEGCMNVLDGNRILVEHLPEHIRSVIGKPAPSFQEIQVDTVRPLREVLARVEEELIRRAMKEARGNVSKAARMLDIPRQTLQYKLRLIKVE